MDELEQLFKKIEDNIFETQKSKQTSSENENPNIISTNNETNPPKKSKKNIINTEIKESRISKLHLEKPEDEIIEENPQEKEKEAPLVISDEYADYCRMDKTGIHFQIISDINVSIEIVPEELLTNEVKQIILKYKGVFDTSMKLWLIPYVNYELIYSELFQIESLRNKLHKVGSIAQEFYQNKSLQKLIIRRKKNDEILDYTVDTKERNPNDLPEKIRKSLYNFQMEGIKFGINHHCRFLLADEMGVGKTLQAISLAYIYRESWPVLVVCPGSMKYNWKGEIQTWLGLKDYRINIINSSRQKLSQEAYFYIISYDLMRNVIKKMRQMTFDFVILDEAHSIKNKDSLRAKNILPIAVRAKRLIIMTGTPLLAKPYEGYPLLYALRPDIFCYFKKFAYRYCDPQPTPMGINWSGTSNTKELHWILSCLMVRRLKSDVLNQLPPKRRQKIEIATNEKVIHELKRTRKNVKGRKGTLECYTLTSKAKIEGVLAYISDIIDAKEKFIVFAYHHEMLDALEKLCKEKRIDYMRIDGTTKQETRYQYVNYFQLNKSCQVAILSIIAASTGITLTAAHMVIFAELTWTPSIMIQAEDRVHRIGQKSEFVDIKYLYGKETLDDFILDKLQKKLTIVSTTLDDKQANFGVKAEQNLINFGSKANDFVRYKKGEPDEEFDLCDMDDMEKKMFDDLGETTGKKEKDKDKDRNKSDNKNVNKNNKNKKKKKKNKKNKSGKKRIKINRNYSDSESESKSDEEKDDKDKDKDVRYPKEEEKEENANENEEINLGKKFKEDSTSRKKEKDYPKESQRQQKSKNKDNIKSKRTSSYSKVRSNMGSKISGIKDLKKYWATNNKEKSVNKITKNKNNLKNGNVSKNTVLTLLSDLLSDEKVEQDKNKDSIIQKNKKEEMKDKEQGQQLDLFVEALYNNQGENKNNKDKENEQFEKDLMVNLHNVNMRRTMSQESTKKTQKSLIEQIDNPEKEFQSHNKRILFPSDRNHFKENIDENVVHNLKDKVPLI
jgi:SWI/SNF-related matrix-associated actin-dependent regulator 1 of chromatin subfamily A